MTQPSPARLSSAKLFLIAAGVLMSACTTREKPATPDLPPNSDLPGVTFADTATRIPLFIEEVIRAMGIVSHNGIVMHVTLSDKAQQILGKTQIDETHIHAAPPWPGEIAPSIRLSFTIGDNGEVVITTIASGKPGGYLHFSLQDIGTSFSIQGDPFSQYPEVKQKIDLIARLAIDGTFHELDRQRPRLVLQNPDASSDNQHPVKANIVCVRFGDSAQLIEILPGGIIVACEGVEGRRVTEIKKLSPSGSLVTIVKSQARRIGQEFYFAHVAVDKLQEPSLDDTPSPEVRSALSAVYTSPKAAAYGH